MNYLYDKCEGPAKHDLSKAMINDKTLYLIEKGWVFLYPPQNVTSLHDRSFMTDPESDYRTSHHYMAAYALVKQRDEPSLFNIGV